LNYDPTATAYEDGACIWAFEGCIASEALNFIPEATVDDGTCYLPGCTDSLASNFDPSATANDGGCLIYRGCTSVLADNFNEAAQVDDGSCVFIGCTDPRANNYDPIATIDSGLCNYVIQRPPPPSAPAPSPGPGRPGSPSTPPLAPALPQLPAPTSPPARTPPAGQVDPLTLSNGLPLASINLNIASLLADWLDEFAGIGSGITALGDVDGDGVPDVAIGAELHDRGSGAAMLVFLLADGGVKSVQTIGRAGANNSVDLRDDDRFGASVVRIGDLDGDGIGEIAVGAPGDDDDGLNAGAVYILFFRLEGDVREVQKLNGTSAGLSTTVSPGSAFGTNLIAPGDLDGDGRPDLLVGAPHDSEGCDSCAHGGIHLIFLYERGRARGSRKLTPSSWSAGVPIAPGAGIGRAMSALRLPSGGLTIALGIRMNSDNGVSRRLSEQAGGGGLLLLSLTISGDYVAHTELPLPAILSERAGFGAAVAFAPDWDGNGAADLMVGAPLAMVGTLRAGALYVLFLGADAFSLSSWARHDAPEPREGGNYGSSVAVLGDVNGDAVADLLVGSPGGESTTGSAYLVLMRPLVDLSPPPPGAPPPTRPEWLWALFVAISPLLLVLLLMGAVSCYRRNVSRRKPQPLLASLIPHESGAVGAPRARVPVVPTLAGSRTSSSARPQGDWTAAISEDEVRLSMGGSPSPQTGVVPVPLQSVSLLSTSARSGDVPGSPHATWPPNLALPTRGLRYVGADDAAADNDRISNGDKDFWGSGASSPESWGTSTLSIIDRQDEAEGGDVVDSGLEVTYQVNYPRAET
jgi:hypothetical protein